MEIPKFLLDPNRKLLTVQPFTNVIDFTALAQGASADGNFTTQSDSDFVILKTTYYAHTVTTGAPSDSGRLLPWVEVTLQDSGSGRRLMNAGVMLTSLFGTGELPYIWPVPYKINGNSTFTATLENVTTGAGESYVIRLSFHGVKLLYGM